LDDLTNEQKVLLSTMYKEYLSLQPALSPEEANYFEDSDLIQQKYLPDYSGDYVSDMCWKLRAKGYIQCTPGDNLANNIALTDKTIVYMENKFKKNFMAITNFIIDLVSKLIP
jgi:hypothetical protein